MKKGKLYVAKSIKNEQHQIHSILLLEDVIDLKLNTEVKVLRTVVDQNSKEIIESKVINLSCAYLCLLCREFGKEFNFSDTLEAIASQIPVLKDKFKL